MQVIQWQWGLNQWVGYLRDKEIPVLPRTRATLQDLKEGSAEERERLSARDLTRIVYSDPYLALKVLRRAEALRSRQLGRDTTTPLAAVLHTGFDELNRIVEESPPFGDVPAGCGVCEARSVLAATIARAWAEERSDLSPDEIAMAALLVEMGELLLWHFAPEMTDKEVQIRDWNERFWALNQRPSEIDFTFRQLTVALAQAWEIPNLVILLIRGVDTPRANVSRLAADAAKLVFTEPAAAALAPVVRDARKILPGASLPKLVLPLPIPEEMRESVIALCEMPES